MSVRFGAVHAADTLPAGFGSEIIAFHQPDHSVSIQYRSLVAEIAAQLPGTKPRAVLIAASAAGVGATTVVLNLSVTLARQDGVRVTVVDADTERPELASRLRISTTPGMRDVIARGNPPAWSVQETGQPQLFALPAHRDDALASQSLAPIIEQLRSRNDWVIIDAGVWHHRLVPLAAACDAIYLVHADADAAAPDAIQAIVTATGRFAAASSPAADSLRFEFFDDLRQQRGIVRFDDVIDRRFRHAELFHGGRGALPNGSPFCACGQVQFGHQLGEPLPLDRILPGVVPVDDLLLVR